jgi:hypothetical protein
MGSPLQRITAVGQNSAGDAVSMTTKLAGYEVRVLRVIGCSRRGNV